MALVIDKILEKSVVTVRNLKVNSFSWFCMIFFENINFRGDVVCLKCSRVNPQFVLSWDVHHIIPA